jgi:hypothetical protein
MQSSSDSVYFRSSPFSLVASEENAQCWAGREELQKQLETTCRSWIRRPDSTVDLMWANLGSGKTHALLHLPHLWSKLAPSDRPIFVFAEIPQDLASFRDLYASFVARLPVGELLEAALRHTDKVSVVIQQAARAYLAGGTMARDTVLDWITAGRPLVRDLRATTGIASRLESDSDVEKVLIDLITIAALEKRRVILMLDEFQRIATLTPRVRDKVLSHLRTVLSRCPTHLSVVFAVASKIEKTAVQLIPAEIRTIMGMRPLIALPALDEQDAKMFVKDRLTWFRPDGYKGDVFAPLEEASVDEAVAMLNEKLAGQLTPRKILQALGLVCDAALDDAESLNSQRLEGIFSQFRWEEQ